LPGITEQSVHREEVGLPLDLQHDVAAHQAGARERQECSAILRMRLAHGDVRCSDCGSHNPPPRTVHTAMRRCTALRSLAMSRSPYARSSTTTVLQKRGTSVQPTKFRKHTVA